MRAEFKLLIVTTVVVISLLVTVFPLRCEIRSPRLGAPVILKTNNTFTVSVKHSLPYAWGDWRFRLQADSGDTLELAVADKKPGFSVSRFELQLPESAATGHYTLLVGYGKSERRAGHAVHIVEQFNRDLKLVQLADLPTLGTVKSDQQLIDIVNEINIINPDLVLFTGDVAYGASWSQYRRLYDILTDVSAPIILAPGNHEYYGWAGYLTLFGKPYHAVQYGDYRVISLNSGHGRDQFSYSQLRWLKGQLEGSEQSQRIIQLHHPVHHRPGLGGFLRGNSEAFTDLVKQHKVSIVLSGHWHGDSLYNENGQDITDTWRIEGTPYVVTTTAGADFRPEYSNSPLHYGYRLIRYRDAELENFTYDYDGDGERDSSSSIPYQHLSVENLGSNRYVIHNGLNEGFKNAMLHIAVNDSSDDLCPNIGHIAKMLHLPGKTEYWLNLDVPAQRDTELTLQKQDACP